ncbi:MAG: hypothetical protein JJU29_23150 [Verrucomicrobia bacterium]|nr:hypothetical protein [Verrucomicrobiota bacterium]MCH8514641.1 hypothetical protein [Kiritimatiellia bacterium]
MKPEKKRILMARLVCVPLTMGLVLLELTPLPVAALFLVYLAIWRPQWFLNWVHDLYGRPLESDGRIIDKVSDKA